MSSVNHKGPPPSVRFTLTQAGQQTRRKTVQEHDDSPLPGGQSSGGLTGIVQERRCQKVRVRVTRLTKCSIHFQGMALILHCHGAKQSQGCRRQKVGYLLKLLNRNPGCKRPEELFHTIAGCLYHPVL
jgi:hypothetical protein